MDAEAREARGGERGEELARLARGIETAAGLVGQHVVRDRVAVAGIRARDRVRAGALVEERPFELRGPDAGDVVVDVQHVLRGGAVAAGGIGVDDLFRALEVRLERGTVVAGDGTLRELELGAQLVARRRDRRHRGDLRHRLELGEIDARLRRGGESLFAFRRRGAARLRIAHDQWIERRRCADQRHRAEDHQQKQSDPAAAMHHVITSSKIATSRCRHIAA